MCYGHTDLSHEPGISLHIHLLPMDVANARYHSLLCANNFISSFQPCVRVEPHRELAYWQWYGSCRVHSRWDAGVNGRVNFDIRMYRDVLQECKSSQYQHVSAMKLSQICCCCCSACELHYIIRISLVTCSTRSP